MKETMSTTATRLVPGATKCQHVGMPERANSPQRTFRLNEQRGKVWDNVLAESGMKQQAAIETLVEALGLRLIDLNDLRAQVVRRKREQPTTG